MHKQLIYRSSRNLLLLAAAVFLCYKLATPHHQTTAEHPPIAVTHRYHVPWRLTGIIWDPDSPDTSAITVRTRSGKSKLISNHSAVPPYGRVHILDESHVRITQGKQSTELTFPHHVEEKA